MMNKHVRRIYILALSTRISGMWSTPLSDLYRFTIGKELKETEFYMSLKVQLPE